jgi:hypothetical protein
MAGGKPQTEDDKPYVFGFIAMLAMNVSKKLLQVLDMNEKFETNQTQN